MIAYFIIKILLCFLNYFKSQIYPCDFYVLDQYCGGNVNENSLREIQNWDFFKKFVEESLPVSEECKNCKWFGLCRGGCRRYREPFEKGIPSLNFYCESYKKFFTECGEKLIEMGRCLMQK